MTDLLTGDMVHWQILRDIASWTLILAGSLLLVAGALGLVRFPDFYARLHAAGVTDTGGAELVLLGLLLQAPGWLVAVKLVFIVLFLALTSPVSTHAVAHTAYMGGLKPLQGRGKAQSGAVRSAVARGED